LDEKEKKKYGLRKYDPQTIVKLHDQVMSEIMVDEIKKAKGFNNQVRQNIYNRWMEETGKNYTQAKASYKRCQNDMHKVVDSMSHVLECFSIYDKSVGRLDTLAETAKEDRDKISADKEIITAMRNKMDFIQKHFANITNKDKIEVMREKIAAEHGTKMMELQLHYEDLSKEDLEKKLLNAFLGRSDLVHLVQGEKKQLLLEEENIDLKVIDLSDEHES